MTYTSRPYTDDSDKTLMLALAQQYRAEHLRVLDLPYRLCSWAFDQPENIRLWFDPGGQLAGWAALQTPFWTIDLTCRPEDGELHAEILAWAAERARAVLPTPFGRPAWFVMEFAGQSRRIAALEAAGFQCQAEVGEDSWSKVFMRRAAAPVKLYPPPAGYVLRPLAGEAEVEAYVELHQGVFESKNMTVEWRRRTLQHPAYRPELDWVVEAPGGKLAAFCIGWLDPLTLEGQIEPLGCHKAYRPKALGRVALSAVLNRLQELGARQIYVETDNYRNAALRLYEFFGFQTIQKVNVFRKDFEG